MTAATRAEVDEAHGAWLFRLGRSTGWLDGFEAGRLDVLTAIVDGQNDTHRRLSGIARQPVWAELERIRREPGGQAWTDSRAAHRNQEYMGGPVATW